MTIGKLQRLVAHLRSCPDPAPLACLHDIVRGMESLTFLKRLWEHLGIWRRETGKTRDQTGDLCSFICMNDGHVQYLDFAPAFGFSRTELAQILESTWLHKADHFPFLANDVLTLDLLNI